MQLKHLRSFVAVAQSLHFGQAARSIGLGQPALSKHLAQLERDVGAELLTRDRRGVALTGAGEVLLEGARVALSRLDAAREQLKTLGAAREKTLVVGQLDYTSHAFLPAAIRALKQRFPDAVVETRDMTPDDALWAVRDGKVDLGISVAPIDAPELVVRDIIRGRWSLVLPRSHALASRVPIELSKLAKEELVLFQRKVNPRMYDWLISRCEDAGFTPRVAHHVAQPQHGAALVKQGVGLLLVGDYVLPELPKGVVMRPLTGLPEFTVVAVWKAETRNAVLKAFLAGLPRLPKLR